MRGGGGVGVLNGKQLPRDEARSKEVLTLFTMLTHPLFDIEIL